MGFGSPNWARGTVWFKRPNDVAIPEHKPNQVSSLQALVNPTKAPIAPPESVVMSGKWAGVRTPNKLGFTPEGETSGDIAARIERKLAKYRKHKADPTEAELAEIAQIREMKAEVERVEIAAKLERQSAIRHALPSEADKQAEIERNEARMRFEEQSLARKVANAEEAASCPILWAIEQNEVDAEMA